MAAAKELARKAHIAGIDSHDSSSSLQQLSAELRTGSAQLG